MESNAAFENLKNEMFERLMELNPYIATMIGIHDPYDKMWGDGSSERYRANLALAEEWNKRMKETIDYDKLSDENKIDWGLIEHALDLERFSFYDHRLFEKNPDPFYEEIGGTIFIMITREYAPFEERIEAITARLEVLPEFLMQFRTRFEKSKPVKLWTEIAIETCQKMPLLFQFIAMGTKGLVSDDLHHRLEKAIENLNEPIKTQLEWLQHLLPQAEEEWALGREKFDRLLKIRNLGMTADDILKLGEKYLHEMKIEREKLAKQIAPNKTVEEVLSDIESEAPKSFEEALRLTEEQVELAKQFGKDHDIATVYEEDKLHVKETPAFMAPLIPFAAMIPPGKFDKKQEGIYIVTRPRDIKNLGKHLNISSIPSTAVHEAYPGHFLMGSCSSRGSLVKLLGRGDEIVEGWAHYCEQMMTEHGFITDPKAKLMQINDVVWRAVRIIVDVKLSRGEMSFDEAVNMLSNEAGMSKEGATVEVRRYTQTPGYQLSYLIGKQLILQMRDEVKQKMGQKFDEKFFHDTITHNGGVPVHLLRRIFEQKQAI